MSKSVQQGQPVSWKVDGLTIAGLRWGTKGGEPLLALHGWLDNAASFTPLAPLLAQFDLVALDLSGHGQSSHRGADATYQIWDDLPQVLGVLDALGWERFSLMGHSRGAIISTILAATHPERVSRLVLLDAAIPPAVPESEFPWQMRSALDEKRAAGREPRVFATPEGAVAVREKGGLTPVSARLLAERNLVSCEGGFRWSTDRRLQWASPVKLTPGQTDALLAALTMPTLLLSAMAGTRLAPELVERMLSRIPDLQQQDFDGGHHFHMDGDVKAVAARIIRHLAD